MIRPLTLVWIALIAGASSLLYAISYEVEGLEDELAALNRQIVDEQETIRVLHAEWAQLNQPERLRLLADAFTDLQPMRPDQLASSIDAVPYPLPGQEYRVPAPAELVAYGGQAETMPLPQRRPSPVAQGSSEEGILGATPATLVVEDRP